MQLIIKRKGVCTRKTDSTGFSTIPLRFRGNGDFTIEPSKGKRQRQTSPPGASKSLCKTGVRRY
jgi:hypothetical protein